MFKALVMKNIKIGEVSILNVPHAIKETTGAPMITKSSKERILDLYSKAHSLGLQEIDFSFKLGAG